MKVALDRMASHAHRALYVGDRTTDRDAAAAAGVDFVATDRGLADALTRAALRRRAALGAALGSVRPPSGEAIERALARHDTLTKPAGSLGRLEELGVLLAGIAGRCPPPVPSAPAVAVFAADHGVVASGVTPWPQDVTGQMVANFVAGGAAINAIARQVGAAVRVVDVGVATDDVPAVGVDRRRVRSGTADLAVGPAMSSSDACRGARGGRERRSRAGGGGS